MSWPHGLKQGDLVVVVKPWWADADAIAPGEIRTLLGYRAQQGRHPGAVWGVQADGCSAWAEEVRPATPEDQAVHWLGQVGGEG